MDDTPTRLDENMIDIHMDVMWMERGSIIYIGGVEYKPSDFYTF